MDAGKRRKVSLKVYCLSVIGGVFLRGKRDGKMKLKKSCFRDLKKRKRGLRVRGKEEEEMKEKEEEFCLTLEEAAVKLKVTYRVVRKLAKRGVLRAFKVNRSWRVRCSDFEEFVLRSCPYRGIERRKA